MLKGEIALNSCFEWFSVVWQMFEQGLCFAEESKTAYQTCDKSVSYLVNIVLGMWFFWRGERVDKMNFQFF